MFLTNFIFAFVDVYVMFISRIAMFLTNFKFAFVDVCVILVSRIAMFFTDFIFHLLIFSFISVIFQFFIVCSFVFL